MSAFDENDIVNDESKSAFDVDDVIDTPKKHYSRTDSFKAGVEQGTTLGFADELKGALNQGLSSGQDLLSKVGLTAPSPYSADQDLIDKGFTLPEKDMNADPYVDARDEARTDYRGAESAYKSKIPFTDIEVNPYNLAGNVTGGLLTAPFMAAKAVTPFGSAGKMALGLDAANIGRNIGIATKVAANSVPLSAAVGVGASEGQSIGEVADDTVAAVKGGAVLSPLIHAGVPVVGKGLSKTGEASSDLLNMIPGEPLNRFKLGMRGVLGVSVKTKRKIEEIINNQVSKFKTGVDSASAKQALEKEVGLHNIENIIGQHEQKIQQLTDDYNNLNTSQTSYKRDAILSKGDERDNLIKTEKERISDEIKSLETERNAMLDDYEKKAHEAIQTHEQDLSLANQEKQALAERKNILLNKRPQEIADSAQSAFTDVDFPAVRQRYDSLDNELRKRDVKFNLDTDINSFEKELIRIAGDDEVLQAANAKIMTNLNKYKGGDIERDKFIELINGYKSKYGKQVLSGLRKAQKGAPTNYEREYQELFNGFENELRSTQDKQLRLFGHEDLADGYKDVNQAYRAAKNLEDTYGNKDYNAKLVSQIKDLATHGNTGVDKGSKGIIKDIKNNSEFFPELTNILPDQLDPYIREATETLPTQNAANAAKIGNLENILSDLRSNKRVPSKFSTNPDDVNLLTSVSEKEAAIEAQKTALQKGQYNPEKAEAIKKLEQELELLKNDPNEIPKYSEYSEKIRQNESSRKKLLDDISLERERKSALLAPKEKTTQLDKMVSTQPVDREDALRKLIIAADKERAIGGAGSATQKLDELEKQLNLDPSILAPERQKLQDMLAAYKDDVDFALSNKGSVAGGFGDFVGAGANIAGYVGNRLTAPVRGVDSALKYIGRQEIPTNSGPMSIDSLMSKISNKPLSKVMEMDSTGQAALKNNLLQISPAVREHLEEKERQKGKK